MDWPTGKYKAILADPPWDYEVWNRETSRSSPELHYSVMRPEQINALPILEVADKDCVLFLWVTYPTLLQGIETLQAWGFTYKTVAFTWMKTYSRSYRPFVGMGHWTRSNAELCLLGTKGNPKRKNKDVEQAILSPVRQHSRKPEIVHERIERLVDGPYLELFARCQRDGWTCWGNQVDKFPPERSLWDLDEVA